MGKNVAGSFFDEVLLEPSYPQTYEEERVVIDFAEALASYMAEKSLSMDRLAKKLNVSKSYVCQILKGKRNISLRSAARYLYKLGLRLKMEVEAIETLSGSGKEDIFTDRLSSWSEKETTLDYRMLIINHIVRQETGDRLQRDGAFSYSGHSGDERVDSLVFAA